MRSDIGRYGIMPAWLIVKVSPQAVRLFAWMAASFADRDGVAWPSRRRLANDLSISPDTVDRAIRDLEQAGALEIEHRTDEAGSPTSNRYRLCFADPAASAKGGSRTDEGTPSRTDPELTRPILNQVEEDSERDQLIWPASYTKPPRSVYEQILRLTGTRSNVVVPESYWRDFKGKVEVPTYREIQLLRGLVRLVRDMWKRPAMPIRLPVQWSGLMDIAAWVDDLQEQGMLNRRRAFDAFMEVAPAGVMPEDTLNILAQVKGGFRTAYREGTWG